MSIELAEIETTPAAPMIDDVVTDPPGGWGYQSLLIRQIRRDGGTQARWRRDGKEILYVAPDRQLMSATVTLGENKVTVDRIEPLFTMRFPYGAYHAFDVTKDGQRILVNTAITAGGAGQQADLKVRLYEEGRQ